MRSHVPSFRAPRRLRWREVAPPGACCHVARGYHRRRAPLPVHTHDFAELFWVERGTGLHWINGARRPLARGDLVFVRPRDTHTFAGTGREGAVIINVAFPAVLPRTLQARLRTLDPVHPRPWRSGAQPWHVALPSGDLAALDAWADALTREERPGAVLLEAVLFDLVRRADRAAAQGEPDSARLPGWLREALAEWRRGPAVSGGPARLAALAGRSVEHVGRTVLRHTGRTTTVLLNEERLAEAARRLRLTEQTIAAIAADCGYESLSHFYRAFRAAHGTTPRDYRLTQRRTIA